jgi:SagB-type dehydrogenase family enzyme
MDELRDIIMRNRDFMKCPDFKTKMAKSDQKQGLPQPPSDKAAVGEVIMLPPFDGVIKTDSYAELLDVRRSEREYTDKAATRAQLAFMLWSTQGIQFYRGENRYASMRPVPSGGARHPFEAYAAVLNVEGLEQGIYHYLPQENVGEKLAAIEYLSPLADAKDTVTDMLYQQKWGADAAFVLFYTCIAYRAEWRYSAMAHRVALIDLGHVGQNAMLGAAALGMGSCCIAAFNNAKCDEVLGVDGVDEYTVYAVTVGNLGE